MADYYPLISRAVTGLDKNTGENRRVLYERARTALIGQLRSVQPPLDEADITRERLALEEAIRKVEADAAAQARPEPLPEAPEPPIEPEAPEPSEVPQHEPPASLRDRGLRDFYSSVAEAKDLGGATSQANRSARETLEALPDEHASPTAAEREETRHFFEPPGEHAAHDFAQAETPADETGELPELPPLEEEHEDLAHRPVRSYGRLIKFVLLILVLAGLAGAAYWQRGPITSMVASLRSTPAAVKPTPTPAPPPAAKPKIPDRVGPSTVPGTPPEQPANAPAAAVAQKVVLYEEQPGNPQGKRYVGSAIWRTETVSPGPGLAPELAVRADVDIPERHMHMTWTLRRNSDKDLPASHTIEIMFTLPADFDQGGVGNVPGVLMKESEQARGVPLAGLSVKVTNGYFLIGLSAVELDMQRNIALLKERGWFDIPIVYTSNKRAILAMEKGPPGQRAFAEAFRAWGE
jgi:hypothetical protein